MLSIRFLVVIAISILASCPSRSEEFIPRKQSRIPGPPLAPEEAVQKFQVPEGFHVELVAAEPDLMNPVAMAFDDRGRIYVTESFEYPRREPGPGRDRVKILEDTDGDGRVDSVKIFAEGLNIPSGIAVGHGGVWVVNSPDLLFLEDTDGDDRADKQSIVVTGFGRDDTHELPNALTWGPDGCLYGLNGVFNRSRIEQAGRVFDFTCAMFRIDPRTRKFDLFCEGTSNPWGIAFDNEGSAFVSACVIDHLWHLTESAYYHRQGGPYPPHTWKAESIVKHQHQMAAYCGIEFFDSDAYPEKYRKKLYMGNIHGGCLNVDRVERSGATYAGFGEPDFLTADDVWFMPVAQKVGPDGCLYVLDWYDRYHCYQDANADPKGVDRGKGRLYRIVHGARPQPKVRDFSTLSGTELVSLLGDANVFNRRQSQLEIAERQLVQNDPSFASQLSSIALDPRSSAEQRMQSIWAMIGSGMVQDDVLIKWLASQDPVVCSWAVRTAGRQQTESAQIREKVIALATDPDPRVRLQVSIAIPKLKDANVVETLFSVLRSSDSDAILPQVVWQNLQPRLVREREKVVAVFNSKDGQSKLAQAIAPRIAARWIADIQSSLESQDDQARVRSILSISESIFVHTPDQAAECLMTIVSKAHSGEILRPQLADVLKQWFEKISADIERNALRSSIEKSETNFSTWSLAIEQLKTLAGDEAAIERLQQNIVSAQIDPSTRLSLLKSASVVSSDTVSVALKHTLELLSQKKQIDATYLGGIMDLAMTKAAKPDMEKLIESMPSFAGGLQATLADQMCQRPASSELLLQSIAQGKLRKELISPNQIRLLASSRSPVVLELVKSIWGTVNAKVSAERQKVVREFTNYLKDDARGDAQRGLAIYDRICGQCHVMHGRGNEVGPNITANGRGSFEQLIVSIFDPSLVIGEAYKSVTILTVDGRVVNGLVVEQTPQRVVIKLQGNKQEIILTDDIEEFKQNEKSLMPEGIEAQMTRQEVADLFALLSLEGPIDSLKNNEISGTPKRLHEK